MSFLSGFIAIIGPPNIGKSTLLNRVLGKKIAITSPKPQTTRNRIVGIYHRDDYQIVFIDTPGIHRTRSLLHKSMVSSAKASLEEVDIILLIVGPESVDDEMNIIFSLLRKTDKPVILAINKIDLIRKENLLPLIESYSKLHYFDAIIPISALYGDGLDVLKEELKKRLTPGPQFFPPDIITDKSEAFLIAEIIREKIYYEARNELPYSSAVIVERLEEDPERNLLIVILIGKNGAMIKRIGRKARMEIERVFYIKVYLELVVRVKKKWSRDTRYLRKLGY
jgi:GTP-binding protein Era